MQLHLEKDELNLLADVLLAQKSPQCKGILDKVMARDLRFDCDELEQTADMLAERKRRLNDEIAQQPNASLKADLHRQLALLERVLERVNEDCVMF